MDVRCKSWRLADKQKLSDQILRIRALNAVGRDWEWSSTVERHLSLALSSSPAFSGRGHTERKLEEAKDHIDKLVSVILI